MPKSHIQGEDSLSNSSDKLQQTQNKKHKLISKNTTKNKDSVSNQKQFVHHSQQKCDHEPEIQQKQKSLNQKQVESQSQQEQLKESDSECQQNKQETLQKYQNCNFKQFFQTLALKIPKSFHVKPQQQIVSPSFTKQQLERIQKNFQIIKIKLLNRQIFKIQNIQFDKMAQIRKALKKIGKILQIKQYGEWTGGAALHVCMETGLSLNQITGILHQKYDIDWWIKAVPI